MTIGDVTHGLIIDQPWTDLILDGKKSWEMRTTDTHRRGPIALIRKGSKQVCAVAELSASQGPFSQAQLDNTRDLHCIPPDIYRAPDYKWFHAWHLNEVIKLPTPVPYVHKNGSVIWAELDVSARQTIASMLNQQMDFSTLEESNQPSIAANLLVPISRDGTVFCPEECARNGVFTVGDKGDEKRFTDFHDALAYLREMPIARWRRPNEKGNWGIVSAVDWID
ncbi:hypothetical protein ABIE61_001095 [Marinobacterium sp. MBR-111]|jgi:hypothetical protein|uniref:ASCH domain-containing protein n=1 Tax=Marinobacterium sp. MBR-111 TaxID=3156463 RepID=UPI003398682F